MDARSRRDDHDSRRGRSLGALAAEARDGLRALHPARFPYPRLALALAIGGLGGFVFSWAKLPLPWMLGAMSFCTLAAIFQLPIAGPGPLRAPMTLVIGVMLGAGFSPGLVAQLASYVPVLIGLLLFMAACALCCVPYFRLAGGFDRTTAFFAGMPGGLIEMVALGDARGGDGRLIGLVHSARILLVVMTLPFLVQWLEGTTIGVRRSSGLSILDAPLIGDLWLVGSAFIGLIFGHLARLPAKTLTGPMLVSGLVHLTGWSDFTPPAELLIVAQLVLGAGIGCSFAGLATRAIGRVVVLTAGATVMLVGLTVTFAMIVSRLTGHSIPTLMLAYSPGGLAEMSLIALALHLDVALVASHHMLRILIVMLGAASLFGWFQTNDDDKTDEPA